MKLEVLSKALLWGGVAEMVKEWSSLRRDGTVPSRGWMWPFSTSSILGHHEELWATMRPPHSLLCSGLSKARALSCPSHLLLSKHSLLAALFSPSQIPLLE